MFVYALNYVEPNANEIESGYSAFSGMQMFFAEVKFLLVVA